LKIDIIFLNTAVLDLRSADFGFVGALVGAGGLARCATADMPPFSQDEVAAYIKQGRSTAGGPGNTAPLLARAGLKVAVGAMLGDDVQGRAFREILTRNGVDMSASKTHPTLPTGTTFIHENPGGERGGIAYFPNANNEFSFDDFMPEVERLAPAVVYYMYSGLSERGDANGGRDLAKFMRRCRARGALTIADSHTLSGNPRELIANKTPVAAYRLLEPLLPELDIFFTSADEARMIMNTLAPELPNDIGSFLNFVRQNFMRGDRPQLFGVTVRNGAHVCYSKSSHKHETMFVESDFMGGEVVDLVGAGDSFRAGVVGYIALNVDKFKRGKLDFEESVQVGNFMASAFIKAPLGNRYENILPMEKTIHFVRYIH